MFLHPTNELINLEMVKEYDAGTQLDTLSKKYHVPVHQIITSVYDHKMRQHNKLKEK